MLTHIGGRDTTKRGPWDLLQASGHTSKRNLNSEFTDIQVLPGHSRGLPNESVWEHSKANSPPTRSENIMVYLNDTRTLYLL